VGERQRKGYLQKSEERKASKKATKSAKKTRNPSTGGPHDDESRVPERRASPILEKWKRQGNRCAGKCEKEGRKNSPTTGEAESCLNGPRKRTGRTHRKRTIHREWEKKKLLGPEGGGRWIIPTSADNEKSFREEVIPANSWREASLTR